MLLPEPDRLDEQAESGGCMPAMRIVEVISWQVRSEPAEHPRQPSGVEIGLNLIERQIGKAMAVKCCVQDQVDGVEDERPVDPHPRFAPAAHQSPAVQGAGSRQPQVDGAMIDELRWRRGSRMPAEIAG